jgi:hypothetical protein
MATPGGGPCSKAFLKLLLAHAIGFHSLAAPLPPSTLRGLRVAQGLRRCDHELPVGLALADSTNVGAPFFPSRPTGFALIGGAFPIASGATFVLYSGLIASRVTPRSPDRSTRMKVRGGSDPPPPAPPASSLRRPRHFSLSHPIRRGLRLERVMNLSENLIGMRITRSAWFLRDLRFPHS